MSVHDLVFIATDRPLDAVIDAIIGSLPGDLRRAPDGMPILIFGHTAVDFEVHDFEADASDHPEIVLTKYPYLLKVRDLERDLDRQEAVAMQVFDVAAACGWPTVAFREMQHLLARYDPPAG